MRLARRAFLALALTGGAVVLVWVLRGTSDATRAADVPISSAVARSVAVNCQGLRLYELEVDGQDHVEGAWMSFEQEGVGFVGIGQAIGPGVLASVALGDEGERSRVWVSTGNGTCQVIQGAGRAIRFPVRAVVDRTREPTTPAEPPSDASGLWARPEQLMKLSKSLHRMALKRAFARPARAGGAQTGEADGAGADAGDAGP